MKAYHFWSVQLCIILCRMSGLYQQEVGLFYHSIDNYSNRIMLCARPWKSYDEVHINYLPLPFWKFYILSQTSIPLVFYFHLPAIRALGNKLNNVLFHTFPPIYLSQIMVHLGGTWRNGISGAMNLFHDPLLESIHPRYTQSTLTFQHTVSPLFKRQYSLIMNIHLQIKQNGVLVLFFYHLCH